MKVHKELLWDYDINAISQDCKFTCFYIERALTHGGDKALQDIDLDEIRGCFPKLHLPSTVRAFWKWYLNQAVDSPFRFSKPELAPEIDFHIDGIRDLAANKLSALFDRSESKDFVDVYFLQKEFKSFDELIADAKQKHVGLENYWLAQAFHRITEITFLPKMVKPVNLEELKSVFLAEAKHLMDNLGT